MHHLNRRRKLLFRKSVFTPVKNAIFFLLKHTSESFLTLLFIRFFSGHKFLTVYEFPDYSRLVFSETNVISASIAPKEQGPKTALLINVIVKLLVMLGR